MSEPSSTYKLKFTGVCGRAEFEEQCGQHDFWYHSFYFDNGFAQPGDYDVGRDLAGYGFPADMSGMEVLDIGTGSGWFAAYFEQLGANVTTTDARGYCDFDVFGRVPAYPDVTREKRAPDRVLPDGRAVYYSPVSKGFWIMRDILGLKAEYVNARAYEIRPKLFGGRKFDLVFMGALLMHLRDPMGALIAARSVCRNRLIATTLVMPTREEETMSIMRLPKAAGQGLSWWTPNMPCLLQWFRGSGFPKLNADRTVTLITDKPFIGKSGQTAASDQTLAVIDASI